MMVDLESLVSTIGSLKAALLVTVDDALLYRSWQRDGERWSVALGAARYGDVLRAARVGLEQMGSSGITQLTIEAGDALALVQPLSDAVAVVMLFDPATPLGLARHHVARLLDDLRELVREVGPVGPAASRRASELGAEIPGSRPPPPPPPPPEPPPPPPPPPPEPVASEPPTPHADPRVGSPTNPYGSPPVGAALSAARAGRASRTLVSESAPGYVMPSRGTVAAANDAQPAQVPQHPWDLPTKPRAVPPEPPAVAAAPLSFEEEDTAPELSGLHEPPTRPRQTSPMPGLVREAEPPSPGARAAQLLAHLTEHAPDAHVALERVALQTGLPLEGLRSPERLSAHDVALVEASVRRILGLDRLEL